MPELKLKDVSFRYDKKAPLILDGISLELGEGECIGLVAANGGGKTTLLSVLAGVLVFQEGELMVGSQHYPSGRRGKRARQDIGFVPQFAEAQFFGLSVREQLELVISRAVSLDAPKQKQAKQKQGDEAFAALLARVDLGADVLNMSPWALSGGERRRLALAFALAQNRSILLFDEPLIGLDEKSIMSFFSCIDALRAEGKGCIIASNVLEELYDYTDRVVLLHEGHIIADGPAQEILSDAALLARVHAKPPLQAQLAGLLPDRVHGIAEIDGVEGLDERGGSYE